MCQITNEGLIIKKVSDNLKNCQSDLCLSSLSKHNHNLEWKIFADIEEINLYVISTSMQIIGWLPRQPTWFPWQWIVFELYAACNLIGGVIWVILLYYFSMKKWYLSIFDLFYNGYSAPLKLFFYSKSTRCKACEDNATTDFSSISRHFIAWYIYQRGFYCKRRIKYRNTEFINFFHRRSFKLMKYWWHTISILLHNVGFSYLRWIFVMIF